MKNQRDKNGQPHGPCEDYYDNGKLHYRGLYRHGEMHGPWECYSVSGKLILKGTFKRRKQVGLWYFLNKA